MPPADPPNAEPAPECESGDCESTAAFWAFDPLEDSWRALCERHTRGLHPSLEIKAWLESGYAKPVELGVPSGQPPAPRFGRTEAFRSLVDRTMGWSGGGPG